MIEEHFRELGFNDNEVKVYLALAEVGKASPALIAKKIGLPRTTVYSIFGNLSEKGLVSSEQQGRSTFFAALPPGALNRALETERAALSRREKITSELSTLIEPLFRSTNFSIPRTQFFEGHNAVENLLYKQTDEWRKSILQYDKILWGYQDHTFVEQYFGWLQWYWPQMAAEEKVQLISNNVPLERKLKGKIPNRTIRRGPRGYNFSSTIWIFGDYIVLIMTKQQPHYAFQIRDPVFGANMREVFKMLWGFLDER